MLCKKMNKFFQKENGLDQAHRAIIETVDTRQSTAHGVFLLCTSGKHNGLPWGGRHRFESTTRTHNCLDSCGKNVLLCERVGVLKSSQVQKRPKDRVLFQESERGHTKTTESAQVLCIRSYGPGPVQHEKPHATFCVEPRAKALGSTHHIHGDSDLVLAWLASKSSRGEKANRGMAHRSAMAVWGGYRSGHERQNLLTFLG